MAKKEKSFYQRLTRLFRSGPAIRRKIRGQDYKNFYDNQVVQNNLGYYGAAGFKREASPFSVMGAYGILDRMSRYAEFASMEETADIATALNVYADESCASDENGRTFHIYSDNPQVQRALEELFYDVMNIEFNARRMVRNLVKNGDYFMYIEVVPDYGVINVEPLPVNEVEREEGFDKHDPYAVRFRLITRGGKYLENWQMLHFRILGNDLFLPYGTSFLESARRPWRQLCVAKGTPVWVKEHGHQAIEDIVPGDTVYCFDSDCSRLVETKVKHIMTMGTQDVVTVSTKHRSITVTPNHGMLIKDNAGAIYKKKAEELTKEDSLILPIVEDCLFDIADTIHVKSEPYAFKATMPINYEPKGILAKLSALGINKVHLKNAHWFLRGHRKISYELLTLLRKGFEIPDSSVQAFWRHSNKKAMFATTRDGVGFDYVPNEDFMRFLGFMYGDGWVHKNIIGFALGVYESQNQYYIDLANKLFPNTKAYRCQTGIKGSRGGSVKIDSTETAELLRAAGFKTGFANKFIPPWVFRCPRKFKQQFIRGLFDADGCKSTGVITFANKQLITDLEQLCHQVGIHTGRIRHTCKEGIYNDKKAKKPVHRNNAYSLWLNITNIDKPNNLLFEKLSSVTKAGTSMTYDLEVEHSGHNFIAASVPVSNTMMEDSMLVYRLVRSPERRVFYVDVSAVHPNDIPSYMEAVKESMRGASVIEQQTGRQDFRYNPLAIDEDYFLPTRPNNQTKIESLAGGQNATAIEDVEYIHKKLIAALMVPKAYLTYDEAISSKATLAQEDIRFSRTVGQLQKILVAELNKLAMIHLYALGFSGDDLLNFDIKFSNPSTVAVQQKLALISSKLEIAGKALELSKETGLLSFNYIQTEILGLRQEQINIIKQEARQDQVAMAELKKIAENPPFDKSIDSNIDIFDKSNYEVPTSPYAPDKKELRKVEIQNQEEEQEYQAKRAKEREEKSGNNSGAPIRFSPTPNLDKSFRKSRRSKAFTGDRALVMPDFKKMLDITNNRYSKDPFDTESIRKFVLEEAEMEKDLFGSSNRLPFGLSKEMQTSLRKLNEALYSTSVITNTEVVNSNKDEVNDELFLIEKELKTE